MTVVVDGLKDSSATLNLIKRITVFWQRRIRSIKPLTFRFLAERYLTESKTLEGLVVSICVHDDGARLEHETYNILS